MKWMIIVVSVLCLAIDVTQSLKIRNSGSSGDSSSGEISASPTLIYRRRLNSDRHQSKQSIYPQTSPRSFLQAKTEVNQYINNDPHDYSSSSTPSTSTSKPKRFYYQRQPTYSTTTSTTTAHTRQGFKKKLQRRNRSRTRTVTSEEPLQMALPQETVENEQYTPKPVKTTKGRRRKIKRPAKIKPSAQKLSDIRGGSGSSTEESIAMPDGVIDPAKVNGSSGSSSGDKNLAVEIGSEDGKYALIDKFFDDKSSISPPGVISYAASDDFNVDNKYTLGNVKENEIWLSEGHLLVLKGGDLDASLREHWKPIDNYQRGKRPPLRIALDSNNPPPFPVFLNETGPPVFLGPPPPFGLPYPPPGSFNESFDPSRLPPPGLVPLYPNGTIPFFGPPPGAFGNGGGNNSLGGYGGPPPGQYGLGGYGQGGYGEGGNRNGSFNPPFQFPPPQFPPGGPYGNGTFPPPPFFPFPPGGNRNGTGPIFLPPPPGFNRNFSGPGGLPPPGFPLLPPFALNPNDNETDDPSIFLPPPYDFDYQDDNTTIVPPGPFAPGLVVPPPKDFYTVYNKTTSRPTFPPATSYFGKRPQRPNGKKPKFPITNPPDDSEEAYLPLTTPTPYLLEIPLKKRKQRPGKANKDLFAGNKYESDTSSVDNVARPEVPLIADPPPPTRIVVSRPPIVIQNIIPTTTTSKPLNNYVYVRGQLKSLAELNKPQDQYQYELTPRPPYDERGYPTRVLDSSDESDPTSIGLPYGNKKPTQVPAKSYYYSTPKYDSIYAPYKTKKPKKQQYFTTTQPQPFIPQQQQGVGPYQSNRLSNQGQSIFTNLPTLPVIDPSFYSNVNQQQQQQGIIQLQSPKSYVTTTTNVRQPHLYNHAEVPGNINYQTTSQFRPSYPIQSNLLNQQNQQEQGGKVIFPEGGVGGGEVTQNGPFFDFRTPLYQQQRRPIDGYYSPISQYYQPLQQQHQQYFKPNTKYYVENRNLAPQKQQQSLFQPQQNAQLTQQYYNSNNNNGQSNQLPNQYKVSQQQQRQQQPIQQTLFPQLQQDIYVNYREPLPQYNTESEAVTTRTVFKAGPSQSPATSRKTVQTTAEEGGTAGGVTDGSYYSFQRGGPGGFSYKIRL